MCRPAYIFDERPFNFINDFSFKDTNKLMNEIFQSRIQTYAREAQPAL